MSDTANLPSPSLLRHLTAMLYDALLVIALVAVANALALGIVVQFSGGEQQLLGANLVRAVTALSVMGFFIVFWLKDGQTLGMQAWRIRLVNLDGGSPSAGQAVLRCVAAFISAGCLGLGYLWRLVDRNGRYWHDYVSRTKLVLLPGKNKKSRQ